MASNHSFLTALSIGTAMIACSSPAPKGPTTPAIAQPTPPPPADSLVVPESATVNPRSVISKDSRIAGLYRCWFSKPYEYMFKPADSSTGQFMAGVRGILYYGNLTSCMAEMTDGSPSVGFADNSPIEAFASIAVLKSDGKFPAYNPAIIKWGHENLIPDPNSDVGGGTAQQRYDGQFRRYFRMMTETLLTLRKNKVFDADQDFYREAVDGGQNGKTYLATRYKGWLPTYDVPEDWSSLTVPMAVGFWLRRGMDSTDGELWIGLKKVLRLYDPTFYADVQKRFEGTRVAW